MKDEEYELVPVSPIKKLQNRVSQLEGQKSNIPMKELNENIERLNEQVLKLVTVNINLQSKITELLIKSTEQVEQVTEMIELLRRASEVESGDKEMKIDMSPVVSELKIISTQNEEIKRGFADLSNYMRTIYRRERLTQAVQTGEAPARPQPQGGMQ